MTTTRRLQGLRIAVDARYLSRPGVGIHRYLDNLLDLMEVEGAQLSLLVADRAVPEMDIRPSRTIVPLAHTGARWEQWSLAQHLRASRYDLYVAAANRGLPLLPHATPTALVVHDLIPAVLWRMYLRSRFRFTIDYLLAHGVALARASTVLAVSEATAADVRRFCGRRATVVYQPMLPREVPHLQSCGTRTVVYNGGDDPRKQVPLLLEAFALVRARDPGIRFRLVGSGYEHYRPLIEDLGLADCLELTGLVTEQARDAALASASVVVLASLYEGFGLPVMEAFACGTPVVAGGGGALAEIGAGAVVRVDVTDARSIADGICRALRPDVAEHAAAAGRRRLAELAALDGDSTLVESLRAIACTPTWTLPPR